ncbi:hypothetical protein Tsubulata_009301 [Turnera subulata]|uniref:Uncharacterized protein n=1 Tax=Turnera subulata TaxID=218843 RepID=A0A9Q0J793_9ROSI|nr:hypothetical protein Tsubulata_009301 [Turnera subulata]
MAALDVVTKLYGCRRSLVNLLSKIMNSQLISFFTLPDGNSSRNNGTESNCLQEDLKDAAMSGPSSAGNNIPSNMVDRKGEGNVSASQPANVDASAEVNMEASITTDDVLRAGGLGARDDISSFLPVASDSTDFEETILNAKNYEGAQGETSRPGLGWTEAAERK